jgi:hypothetical protein
MRASSGYRLGQLGIYPALEHRSRVGEEGAHAQPKSGTKRPSIVRRGYLADVIDYRLGRIGASMVFGRAAEGAPSAG